MVRQGLLGEETTLESVTENAALLPPAPLGKLWIPKRIQATPDAAREPYGAAMIERLQSLGLTTEVQKSNRLSGLRGADDRETYKLAKSALGLVVAPPSAFKLQPIPPSADFQFHLAEGCPAHCQYCYLAGSLTGPPVVRVFANLPQILENTARYEKPAGETSFEVSCYTDPLSLEHLTGSLSACIQHFGKRERGRLRFVTKFSAVESLLGLAHSGHTRARISMNVPAVAHRLEGGTARLPDRIAALRKLALPKGQGGGGGYPIGVVLAPIMPVPGWEEAYTALLADIRTALDFPVDLTFECITHRFTPGSKEVLLNWYPATTLDLDESKRTVKRNKFGGTKYVFTKEMMTALRSFLDAEIKRQFPEARVLYWT